MSELQQPVGFIHFDAMPRKVGSIILNSRPTPQELRDFWTNGLSEKTEKTK